MYSFKNNLLIALSFSKAAHINHVQVVIQHEVPANSQLPDITGHVLDLFACIHLPVPDLARHSLVATQRLLEPNRVHHRPHRLLHPPIHLLYRPRRPFHVAALGLSHPQFDGRQGRGVLA